jgi:hypothetical protein
MELHEGMPIFLVVGATGEYDDHHEWVVCAYRNIESAQEHAKKAEEEAKRLFDERPKNGYFIKHVSPFDANMHIDYTGTNYYIEETSLHAIFRL